MKEGQCPACGAQVRFKTSICLFSVCSFCRSLVQRKDPDLAALGTIAQLQNDGTPLQIGAAGHYRGAAFELVGRLQLRLPLGFWNEWSMAFSDGRHGWLGEAQGNYAVSFQVNAPLPEQELKPGGFISLDSIAFRVRERVRARYLSAEGELPFRPPLNDDNGYASLDLAAPGGRFATIDYSEKPPLVFVGEYQDFDALALTGLRQFEGWT